MKSLRFDENVKQTCFELFMLQNVKSMTEKFHNHIIGNREGSDRRNSLSPSPYDRSRRLSKPNSRPGSPTWLVLDILLD